MFNPQTRRKSIYCKQFLPKMSSIFVTTPKGPHGARVFRGQLWAAFPPFSSSKMLKCKLRSTTSCFQHQPPENLPGPNFLGTAKCSQSLHKTVGNRNAKCVAFCPESTATRRKIGISQHHRDNFGQHFALFASSICSK